MFPTSILAAFPASKPPQRLLILSIDNTTICYVLAAVQSHVVGIYMLHSVLSGCGAPELLSQLDDAVSDTMGEPR